MRQTQPTWIELTAEPAPDEPLLEPVLREHRDDVVRYLVRRLDRAEVPDALADVVAVARRHLRAAPPEDGRLWLYSIASRVVDVRAPRETRVCGRCAADADRPDRTDRRHVDDVDDVDDVLDVLDVLDVVDQLDPLDREVLRLHAWEDLDAAQIAVVTGLTERVVRLILDEISDRLRVLVDTTGETVTDDSMWMAPEVTA